MPDFDITQRAVATAFVTFTIANPSTTYTTTVALGNDPTPAPVPSPKSSPSNGAVIGAVIGSIIGFLLLLILIVRAFYYVFYFKNSRHPLPLHFIYLRLNSPGYLAPTGASPSITSWID